jgi:hypothetical protein
MMRLHIPVGENLLLLFFFFSSAAECVRPTNNTHAALQLCRTPSGFSTHREDSAEMPLLRPSCPASEGKRSRRERARSGETAHAALKPCRLMLKFGISVCI